MSLPAAPKITLVLASPVKLSAWADPVKFSIFVNVSFPFPTAVFANKLALMLKAEPEKSAVSISAPPSKISSPASPNKVSLPAPPDRVLAFTSPVNVSL